MTDHLFLKFIWVLIKALTFTASQLKLEFERELSALKEEK